MTVDFYRLNDVSNKLNKTIENPYTLTNVLFKDNNIDLLNPYLKLHSDISQYNYCYIRELQKYYFINNIIIENNDVRRINLKIDLLMTYKDIIKNSVLDVTECEKDFVNSEKADGEKKDNIILSKIEIDTDDIFSGNNIVMVVKK